MDVLLDTHTWAWTLNDDARLTQAARNAITKADSVRVSPISFFEIGQKVRVGKWPEMAGSLEHLADAMTQQGALSAPFTNEIALQAAGLNWSHRDPFDRILAATALVTGAALVSADTAFDTLTDHALHRIW